MSMCTTTSQPIWGNGKIVQLATCRPSKPHRHRGDGERFVKSASHCNASSNISSSSTIGGY
ncbi:unnamed protein product, partial [Ceratitis capitata]